jgi:hypothetical protein
MRGCKKRFFEWGVVRRGSLTKNNRSLELSLSRRILNGKPCLSSTSKFINLLHCIAQKKGVGAYDQVSWPTILPICFHCPCSESRGSSVYIERFIKSNWFRQNSAWYISGLPQWGNYSQIDGSHDSLFAFPLCLITVDFLCCSFLKKHKPEYDEA